MLRQFDEYSRQISLEDWYLEFPPAQITIHSLKTGRQAQDLSLIAVARSQTDKLAAMGREALQYQDNPDFAVFSPFRRGQIVQFPAAALLIKSLLGRIGPKLLIPKPVMCVRIQEHTTQVEEQALAEAAIQCGARKVFLYTDSLPAMLDLARSRSDLQSAVLIHIESQD